MVKLQNLARDYDARAAALEAERGEANPPEQ
jgi:hypothetical protein